MNSKEQAERLFEERFRKHMHGHIGNFKQDFKTLYNKVIIPLLSEQVENAESLVNNNDVDLKEYADQFKPKWISVEDEKPELNKIVLVTTNKYDLVLSAAMVSEDGKLFGVKFGNGQYHELISVQFWMPLPEKPEI